MLMVIVEFFENVVCAPSGRIQRGFPFGKFIWGLSLFKEGVAELANQHRRDAPVGASVFANSLLCVGFITRTVARADDFRFILNF